MGVRSWSACATLPQAVEISGGAPKRRSLCGGPTGAMSSLRAIDLTVVDDLVDFVRGRGYVLHFSDSTFSQFFATELDVDIYDSAYADFGGSKGKRLRCFLQKVDDRTALLTLKALW